MSDDGGFDPVGNMNVIQAIHPFNVITCQSEQEKKKKKSTTTNLMVALDESKGITRVTVGFNP